MKFIRDLFVRSLATLVATGACVAPLHAAETPVPLPAVASPTADSGALAVPLDRWLVVTATAGKGLKVGGGVRLRRDGFDTAEGEKGSANPSECVSSAAGYTCANGLQARILGGGSVKIEMGPVAVTAAVAREADARRFSGWLDAAVAQQKACSAAAQCCMAAEGVLGKPCDLNALLGDRKLATCQAALGKTRAALTAAKAAVPAVCGN